MQELECFAASPSHVLARSATDLVQRVCGFGACVLRISLEKVLNYLVGRL